MRKQIFGGGNDDGPSGATRRPRRSSENPGPPPERGGHFVYMVRCCDGSIYTGYTTDPVRRLAEHNGGRASKYTRSRRPVALVYLEEFDSRGEALSRELRVKTMKKEEKLLLCRTRSGREKHRSR